MTRPVVGNRMNWKSRLARIFALRCEGATELASQEQDGPLGFPERLALRGHLLACTSCRCFRRQLQFLREASRRIAPNRGEPASDELSATARERIALALREAESGGESPIESG